MNLGKHNLTSVVSQDLITVCIMSLSIIRDFDNNFIPKYSQLSLLRHLWDVVLCPE